MKTELLAPAKNKEIAFAAIDCGADAIYIGAPEFGARHNASNSIEDIKEVVDYAHKFWVKVCVTLNTILTDEELNKAIELVKILDEIGVDALIVQDFGLLEQLICRKDDSVKIAIHMSTQCDNREPEKIKFFNKLGVQRVVLARELSLDTIKQIHNENPNLELECFVHGALCVSYSGQCYLSQYIGGRSANRGECAQPCRKKYSVVDENGQYIAKDIHALCLKDFNASGCIPEMVSAGVYSFKIEGRLKDIGYVKNITAYYRQELDKYSEKSSSGRSVYSFSPNPEKSFNRGFTDYFLKERGECFNFLSPKSRGEYLGKIVRLNKDSFVIQTDKEIHPQDGLCFYAKEGLEGFLVNKTEQTAIRKSDTYAKPSSRNSALTAEKNVIVYPNRKIEIKSGAKIYRNNDIEFEKELLKPVKRQIGLKVLYKNNCITLIDEDGVSLNLDIEAKEEAKNQEKMNTTFVKQFSKTGESDFYIEDIKIASDLPFMPVSEMNQLRRDAFEKLMQKRLETYKREYQKPLSYAEYYKKEVDYRANVHNKSAKEFYEKCGCSVSECSIENKLPKKQIELMRTKHCIKYALGMCKSPKKLFLKDEKGINYPLQFDCKNCEMAIILAIAF